MVRDRPLLALTLLMAAGCGIPVVEVAVPGQEPSDDQLTSTPPAPVIAGVHGRDGVVAVDFENSARTAGASFLVRSTCSTATTQVSASPARITGIPFNQDCAFTVQTVAPYVSGVSAPSAAVRMRPTQTFGYYNYYHGLEGAAADAAFALAPVKDHANATFIHLNDPHAMARVAEAVQQNVQVVIDVSAIFYQPHVSPLSAPGTVTYYLDRTTLRSDAVSRWEDFARQVRPYRSMVAAFYDEEPYWTAAYQLPASAQNEAGIIAAIQKVNANLQVTVGATHASFPEIPYAVVDEGLAFAGRVFINGTLQTCVSCRAAIQVPSTVDWVGFEGEYPATVAQFGNWEGFSLPEYLEFTKAKLSSPSQRIVMAPPAFVTRAQRPEEYTNLAQVTDAFFELARGEPRLAAVFPYFWAAPPDTRVGLYEQTGNPLLRNRFRTFGTCVQNAFQGAACAPPSIPAGPFMQGYSIYKSDGAHGYCGFTSMAHFSAAYPGVNPSTLPSHPVVPAGMVYSGACPEQRSCVYAGGAEPGTSCVYAPAQAQHGVTVTAGVVVGGTGARTARCHDGAWENVTISCSPLSIAAGPFTQLPSIYLSDGAFTYCGFTSWDHFVSYFPNANVASLPAYAVIPTNMAYQGACPQKRSCTFEGGALAGGSCVYAAASGAHGQTSTAVSVSGGTGSVSARCNDGTWEEVVTSCTPPSIPPGQFRSGEGLFYSNGAHQYCAYASLQQYLAQGGNPNVHALVAHEPIPVEMIFDGTCQ